MKYYPYIFMFDCCTVIFCLKIALLQRCSLLTTDKEDTVFKIGVTGTKPYLVFYLDS